MKRAELSLGLILKPRSFVISSSTHALLLRPFDRSPSKQLIVEFVEVDETTETGIKLAPCWGCLGILEIEREIFIVIVTHATPIGILQPSHEQIHRVVSVDLFCLTSAAFDYQHIFHHPTGNINSSIDFDEHAAPDHPALSGIKKILSNGQFYFSTTVTDLSSRTEHRVTAENRSEDDSYRRFSWNSFMLVGLSGFQHGLPIESRLQFDRQNFLVSVIQGFVATYELKLPPPPPSTANDDPLNDQLNEPISFSISLFSRLGSRRAGTRFNTRGIDDDGNVANFVESETLIVSGSNLFSFVQIRGSVPLFFEQSGTGMTNVIGGLSGQGHRTQLTRTGIATQPAFERHFEDLLQQYPSVHIINLLSNSREGECSLSQAYQQRLKVLARDEVQMAHFDLHQRAKAGGLDGVRHQLKNDLMIGGQIEQMGSFLASMSPEGQIEVVTRQDGVFRVNCLDCLDRTNVIQEMLSRMAVEAFLSATHPHLLRSDYLWNCHRTLWADNGDVLSKIYAGTGALNTSFTRGGKQTFSGILSNASKSVGRMYNSNFIDKSKQAHIDLMLGNLSGQKPVKVFDPLNDTIKKMLHDRRSDYSQTLPISLWVGTYNLNGRAPPMANNDELMAWLCPTSNFEPDIMAVSFQEIVKLSPQQIMITDPEKKNRWERVILTSLENRPNKKSSYAIIRSDQLVGAALIILAKTELVPAVRSVEAKTKKTGLKGIAGNKGAVAIRLDIHDSSFCFVTAHFAAGLSNVEERNHDYETIEDGLKFLRGKTIASHENVIWAGDFNYRIDGGLQNNAVRQAVVDENYAELLAADQLLEHMAVQAVFPKYTEGAINFPPTYKYDVGTDRYDTSEKMRIPAWTDRILYQGSDLNLIDYSRAELKASDHRPVYATLETKVRMVDRVKKEVIKQEILESSEVGSLRDALMMPLQAGDSSSLEATVLDEWWKTPEHPNGTCELNPPEQAQGIGGSSNPFIPNIGPPRPGRQCSTPEANPVGSNRLFNGKLDRQISSSVPSSPPPQVGKGIPPAIPARPASRSPSETRKPVTEKSGSTLKAQPPPPPPRPTSKLIVSKDNTLVEIIPKGPPRPPPTTSGSLLTSQISPTSTETFNSRARSLSGRKSAPSGLQLGVPPPPSHPALKLPHRQESVKSPLLSASTSKLISGKQVTPIRPGYTTPPPPPRPASRGFANTADAPIGVENPQFSPRSTLKLPQRRETTPAELDSNNPPLPPRPVSRLLNSEDPPVVSGVEPKGFVSLNVLAGKGIDSAELDRKNPTPPPRPASRIVFGKELATNGGGIGTEGPSLPARPVSTLLTAGNPSIRLEVKGSSPLPGPSSVLDTGVYTSSPSPPPRSAGQLTTTHRPPPPSRKASKLSLNNEAPPEPPQPATPLRPALKASPSKDNCLVDLDDHASAILPVASIVTPPPPIPPKPKPPKPALKPKPLVLRKSASHESRSLRPADPPNSCQ
ncbi:inositol polyphosphate 5-phosphatase [Puccinia graminis f. sp. tritici]|uniref:phosphoinositide 5-phosphatase n=1 Tax=Puccinia graminis f. sp. tritici TaxID=56615 RepID=A0A5B0RJ39_PUCGR|nr:inositol polyphosphate 5-phosphatase [Puccinia graminis f. sp. tritici]